jgi:hypothetical protein
MAFVLGCAGAPPRDDRSSRRPDGPPPQLSQAERLAKTMRELTPRLHLREDQVPKVRGIMQVDIAKREKLRPEKGSDPRKELAKLCAGMEKIDQETRRALSTVLSEAQLEAYDRYQEDKHKQLRPGARPGGRWGDVPPHPSMDGDTANRF